MQCVFFAEEKNSLRTTGNCPRIF